MTLYYSPGRYRCNVESQGWAEAKTSGRPMILLEVRPIAKIVQGAEGPQEDYVDGQYTRTVRLVVNNDSPKQMEMMMKKLHHAGFEGGSFAYLNLQGKDVECHCEPRKYEGKDLEQWDLALPPLESVKSQPFDAKIARRLDALCGKVLKDKPKGDGAPKADPQPAAVQQASGDDDDPPF